MPYSEVMPVRTTLTLDDDLAAELHRLAREAHRSFRDVVNEAIRRGLATPQSPLIDVQYPTTALHLRTGIDLSKARHLAATLDDEDTLREVRSRA